MKISFVIPGRIQAKQRHRTVAMGMCTSCHRRGAVTNGGCKHCGAPMRFLANVDINPSETKSYENWVASCAKDAMEAGGVPKFGEKPIKVTAVFHFEIPKGRTKKLAVNDWHAQRPDADNCKKSVLDGLNRVAFTDDCIVSWIEARKVWDASNYTEITVEEL